MKEGANMEEASLVCLRRRLMVLLIILAFQFLPLRPIISSPISQVTAQERRTDKFINGQWFDGKGFRRRTYYSVNGILTQRRPKSVDEVIDLKSGYVVPPFGDSHCHHFDGERSVAQQIDMYLRDGVFYAKVTNNFRSGARRVAALVNKPTSVDVSYAHGGLTSNYSHPMDVYEALALGYYTYQQWKANAAKIWESRKAENDAYYIIENASDLDRKWPLILEGHPDFIKIFLRDSEIYQQRRSFVPTTWGRDDGGIDPKLVPAVVEKAHQAHLRVTAAVNSAYDFHVAVNAGVDEISHLPGYQDVGENENCAITREDAALTVKRGVYLTLVTSEYEHERTKAVIENETHNFALLKPLRAKFALGSDAFGRTPTSGAIAMSKLGMFDNLELLKIWCENTAATILPGRKIGHLKEGYEASFLVLNGNPLKDFEQVKAIRFRFKQGEIIGLEERKP
jgi:imidazolonepropionase-like amidohydrolase